MGLFTSKAEKLYRKGRDELRRSSSPGTAMAYFQEAAALGHDGAGLILGDCYRKGDLGLPQDGNKALENYALVREPIGRFGEGLVYYFGTKGVAQDDAKALALFQAAYHAKKYSVLEAGGFLGALYFWGRGVEQDDEKAAKLLSDFMTVNPEHYPDAEYCYYCLRYHGRGGLGQDTQLALKNLPRIIRYAQSQEVREAAQHLIWEDQAGKERAARQARAAQEDLGGWNYAPWQKQQEAGFPETRELEAQAKEGSVQAACLLAESYIRASRSSIAFEEQRHQALEQVLKNAQGCDLTGRVRIISMLNQYRPQLEFQDPELYTALRKATMAK